jgi:uncharacterized membrane protein YbhN (UPF0104 family)
VLPVTQRARRHGTLVRAALALAVLLGVLVGVLPRLGDLNAVWRHITDMEAFAVAALGTVAVGSLLAYGLVLMSVMPGLTLAQAMVVSQSSTAVANTVPAGGALALGVSYRFYRSWGFSRPAITRNVLLTGAWNLLCKLALPLVVLVIVVAMGQASAGAIAAAVFGLVVLALALGVGGMALASEPFARRIGNILGVAVTRVRGWFRRSTAHSGGALAVRFRFDTLRLLRQRSGRLTTAMLLYHASVFAILLLSLRGVGVGAGEVSWIDAMAAFSLARLASAVPITPGGIGLVDLGLAGSLIAAGGPHAGVVAGVLVFRILSFFPPLPLGLISYVVWRTKQTWRQSSDAQPRCSTLKGDLRWPQARQPAHPSASVPGPRR